MSVVEPPTTIAVVEAVTVRTVARSRQVEYFEVELVMSYWSWSVAVSQRPKAWTFQPVFGLVRE